MPFSFNGLYCIDLTMSKYKGLDVYHKEEVEPKGCKWNCWQGKWLLGVLDKVVGEEYKKPFD